MRLPLRSISRRIGFGRAKLRLLQAIRFGLHAEIAQLQAKLKFVPKAAQLAPLASGTGDLDCVMLLNEPRILEGIWALYSFRSFYGECRILILNDGSLSEASLSLLNRIFPGVSIPDVRENDDKVAAALIKRGLERCADWRANFVFFRKLIDPVFLCGNRPYVLLDSDVLHFRPPREILDWAKNALTMCYASDVELYPLCAPATQLRQVCGSVLPEHFCAGYLGLTAKLLSLERIEAYLASPIFRCQQESGTYNHVAEQTLYAMEAAVSGSSVLPADYATCPDPMRDKAVMGHFCGGEVSRTWFYTKGLPILAKQFLG